MELRNKGLLAATLILTALATVARVLMLPVAAGDGTGLTSVYYPLFFTLVIAAGAALVIGRVKKGEAFAAPAARTPFLDAAGALFGVVLTAATGWEAYAWFVNGTAPAPSTAALNAVDEAALCVSLFAGLVGGVFLIARFVSPRRADGSLSPAMAAVTGVAGALAGVSVAILSVMNWREATATALTDKARQQAMIGLLIGIAVGAVLAEECIRWLLRGEHKTGWFWLLPVVWLFARVVRYDVVYATSVDIAPAVYEFLTYGVALLFLLAAAQYFAGVGKSPRWLRGLAAATAVLTLAAPVSRWVLMAMGQEAAVAYCPLPGAADAVLGLFALLLAAHLTMEKPDIPKEENA